MRFNPVGDLRDCGAQARTWFDSLCEIYRDAIDPAAEGFEPSVNMEFQGTYKDVPLVQDVEHIRNFWKSPDGAAFAGRVRSRRESRYLFTQPMVLALYASLQKCQHQLTQCWPYEGLAADFELARH